MEQKRAAGTDDSQKAGFTSLPLDLYFTDS
jgi:hypothetical protein